MYLYFQFAAVRDHQLRKFVIILILISIFSYYFVSANANAMATQRYTYLWECVFNIGVRTAWCEQKVWIVGRVGKHLEVSSGIIEVRNQKICMR